MVNSSICVDPELSGRSEVEDGRWTAMDPAGQRNEKERGFGKGARYFFVVLFTSLCSNRKCTKSEMDEK